MGFDTVSSDALFTVDIVRRMAGMAQRIQAGMAMMNLTKSDLSPATVADFAIQAIVSRELQTRFPEDVLVAEETSKDLRNSEEVLTTVARFVGKIFPDATAENVCEWIDRGKTERAGRCWVLDPIDGTRGYARGGQYAVALALLVKGEVQIGALGCPNLDEDCKPAICGSGAILVAERGKGAWSAPMDDPDAPFTPIHVSDCATTPSARLLRSHEAAHTNAEKIVELAQTLGLTTDPMLMDSQAKYAALAAGHGEILVRLLSPSDPDYRECIWDHTAGSILVEEAGGRVTDLDGKALDFTVGRTLAHNRGLVASNGLLHEAVLNALRQTGVS